MNKILIVGEACENQPMITSNPIVTDTAIHRGITVFQRYFIIDVHHCRRAFNLLSDLLHEVTFTVSR